MLLSDAVHDDTIAANVRNLQEASVQHLQAMAEGLAKMHDFAMERQRLLEICSQAGIWCRIHERNMDALNTDMKTLKQNALDKAQNIIRRERDEAGQSILDIKHSMDKLREDFEEKLRLVEKELVSANKGRDEAVSELTATKRDNDEALEKLSKLMRELKATTNQLNQSVIKVQQLEDEKVSNLEQIKTWGEKHNHAMGDVTSKAEAIERLEADIEALEAKVKALEDDKTREVARSSQLQVQLNESGQLVRDAEAAVCALQADITQLSSEMSYKRHCALMVAESKIENERRRAGEQVRLAESRCTQLEGEMNSQVVMIKVENKKLTRRARDMDQQIQDQHSRAAHKIMARLLRRSLWMAFFKWQSGTEESRKLRNVTTKVVERWRGSVVGRAMETWQHRSGEERRLRRAGEKVLNRWKHQVLFHIFLVLVVAEIRTSGERCCVRSYPTNLVAAVSFLKAVFAFNWEK